MFTFQIKLSRHNLNGFYDSILPLSSSKISTLANSRTFPLSNMGRSSSGRHCRRQTPLVPYHLRDSHATQIIAPYHRRSGAEQHRGHCRAAVERKWGAARLQGLSDPSSSVQQFPLMTKYLYSPTMIFRRYRRGRNWGRMFSSVNSASHIAPGQLRMTLTLMILRMQALTGRYASATSSS
jgi:hypothetical protein